MPVSTDLRPVTAAVPPPPPARRIPVRETVHGRDMVDPYRYLEDGAAIETRAFIEEQNRYARSILDGLDDRQPLANLLGRLLQTGSVTPPRQAGERIFYTRRDAGQDQPVLYVAAADGTGERVLYDPTEESERGLIALDWYHPSPDGSLVAFGASANGDEWSLMRIRRVDDGIDLPDRIERARDCSLAWETDLSGFYYTRYPAPGTVPAGEEYFHKRVYHHVLGSTGTDPEVFGIGRLPTEMPHVDLSADGRYVLVEANQGWARSELHLLDRRAPDRGFRPVFAGADATFSPIVTDSHVYVLTNHEASGFRLLGAPVERLGEGAAAFAEILPEDPDGAVLHGLVAHAQGLAAVYLRDAVAQVRLFDRTGGPGPAVDLPSMGTVVDMRGDAGHGPVYLLYTSFTQPPVVFRLDPQTGALARWGGFEAPAEVHGIHVRQVFFASKDGTRVPMFVLTGPDLPADGPPAEPAPAVLEGYGGFRIARTPDYLARIVPWLRRGGVYAIANLRGGSEYGERWHKAGMWDKKQNVFNDFIAAAEYLLREGYTRSDRLGIYGGSNGGLLVGATFTQRPDLVRAVRCAVPLLDMLRYHKFRLGGLWTAEYGSPDDPEQFAWIHAYSPYHHVVQGTRYPAVFLSTADSDSRVDPMHALKMTALLQHDGADLAQRPVILSVEMNAGHGMGKPVHKVVDELVDVWSFMAWQLGAPGGWR